MSFLIRRQDRKVQAKINILINSDICENIKRRFRNRFSFDNMGGMIKMGGQINCTDSANVIRVARLFFVFLWLNTCVTDAISSS